MTECCATERWNGRVERMIRSQSVQSRRVSELHTAGRHDADVDHVQYFLIGVSTISASWTFSDRKLSSAGHSIRRRHPARQDSNQ